MGVSTGIAIAGIASGAATSLIGGSEQAGAANNAAQLQFQEQQQALQFQEQVFNQGQTNAAPYLQAGREGLANLEYLMGIGSPLTPAAPGAPGTPGAPPLGQRNPTGNPLPGPPGITLPPANNSFSAALPTAQGALPGPRFSAALPTAVRGPLPGPPGAGLPTAPRGQGTLPSGPLPGAPGFSPTGGTLSFLGLPNLPVNPTGGGGGISNPFPGAPGSPAAAPAGPAGYPATPNTALGGFGSLMQGYSGGPFQAPTGVTEANDPGYQFRLAQGQTALQNSAAARGGLLSGGTADQLTNFAQQDASNEYSNVYNRALENYQTNYNEFQQQQTNQFNRLADIAGIGQTSTQQLNALGLGTGQAVGSDLISGGANIGNALELAGGATASGYVGAGNALSGGLSNLSALYALNQNQQNPNGPYSQPLYI